MIRIRSIMALLFAALLIPTAAFAAPQYPEAKHVKPGVPYRLGAGQIRVLAEGSNKEAFVARMGPALFSEYSAGNSYFEGGGRVDLVVAPTGKKAEKHDIRCHIKTPDPVEFTQYQTRLPATLNVDAPYDKFLVQKLIVQDGDDGKVDGQFGLSFYFVEDQDTISFKPVGSGSAWQFLDCRITVSGVGQDFANPVPMPVLTLKNETNYLLSPATPKFNVPINGSSLIADVMSLNGLAIVPTNYFPGLAFQSAGNLGAGGGTIGLRVARLQTPSTKHSLRCYGTAGNLKVQHFRAPPGSAPNDFSKITLFKSENSVQMKNKNDPESVLNNYDFFFGPSGQDFIMLKLNPGQKIFSCSVYALLKS